MHSGPLRYFEAQGFFLTFLASFPEGPKISFFVSGTLFGNLKVNSDPFWVPKRGPGGYLLEVFWASGEGLNFGLIVRRFFYKNSKHAKSQNIDFYCHAQCFVRVPGLEKARGPRQTCKFFFILFSSKNRAKIEETSEKNGDQDKSR